MALIAGLLAGCMTGGVITDVSQGAEGERALIEGDERPLFLGDERLYVRFVDTEDLGGFSTGVYVDPGGHCIVGELTRSGLFNSEDGWTEPLCFEAEAGHVYRLRYRSGQYQIVDDEDGSVLARGGRTSQRPIL